MTEPIEVERLQAVLAKRNAKISDLRRRLAAVERSAGTPFEGPIPDDPWEATVARLDVAEALLRRVRRDLLGLRNLEQIDEP